MEEKIKFNIVGDDIVRRITVVGRGLKTSKLPIPEWVDRTQPLVDIYDISWLAAKERPRVRASAQEIRAVDLFCGCGGLTLGIREAARGLGCAFRSVFAADTNKDALHIYSRNFQPDIADPRPIEKRINGDLGAELTPEEKEFCDRVGKIDIMVAGPPCQGHSNLNNHTRHNDPRNLLYLRAVRCAEILSPQTMIIENVPGILHDSQNVLLTAEDYFKKLGYSVSYGVVKMWKIGVAQTRQRLLLLASKVNANLDLQKIIDAATMPKRPISWAIGDLLDKYDVNSVFNSASVHDPINQNRIHYLFENNLYNLPSNLHPVCHQGATNSYPAVYGRMHWDRPSSTITCGFASCGRGRFIHPLRERTLTPHEAARVQYFPDFFDFCGLGRTALTKAVGNAVPARAGYVAALPLLLGVLEESAKWDPETAMSAKEPLSQMTMEPSAP